VEKSFEILITFKRLMQHEVIKPEKIQLVEETLHIQNRTIVSRQAFLQNVVPSIIVISSTRIPKVFNKRFSTMMTKKLIIKLFAHTVLSHFHRNNIKRGRDEFQLFMGYSDP
jgi:hypothetical protein